MIDLFTLNNLFTLGMLILLQAVLGFDNLLYISIESKRVIDHKQSFVRRLGIGLAIFLRIALLFALVGAIKYFQKPFLQLPSNAVVTGQFNIHSLIVIVGGAFVIYTSTKEIMHMLTIEDVAHHGSSAKRSVPAAIAWIVIMNLIFSFDSILSAIALTNNVVVMTAAIIVSGIFMILLADHVAEFLQKNRLYEVLGLFILFIVGIMLISEGGHLAHLKLFGHAVEPMTKSTFYFVIVVLVLIDIVQGRYQKKIMAERQRELLRL